MKYRKELIIALLILLFLMNVYIPLMYLTYAPFETLVFRTTLRIILIVFITLLIFVLKENVERRFNRLNLMLKASIFLILAALLAYYRMEYSYYIAGSHILYCLFLYFINKDVKNHIDELPIDGENCLLIDYDTLYLILCTIGTSLLFVLYHKPSIVLIYTILYLYTIRNTFQIKPKYLFIGFAFISIIYTFNSELLYRLLDDNNAALNIINQVLNNTSISSLGLNELSRYRLTGLIILFDYGLVFYLLFIGLIVICIWYMIKHMKDTNYFLIKIIMLYFICTLTYTLTSTLGIGSYAAFGSVRNDLPLLLILFFSIDKRILTPDELVKEVFNEKRAIKVCDQLLELYENDKPVIKKRYKLKIESLLKEGFTTRQEYEIFKKFYKEDLKTAEQVFNKHTKVIEVYVNEFRKAKTIKKDFEKIDLKVEIIDTKEE